MTRKMDAEQASDTICNGEADDPCSRLKTAKKDSCGKYKAKEARTTFHSKYTINLDRDTLKNMERESLWANNNLVTA